MSESVTLKSYFYEVLIPSSQKNTSSPIEDILHHVSISFMKKLALYKCFNPRTHTGCDTSPKNNGSYYDCFNPRTHTGCDNKVQNEVKKASEFQSTHPHGVRRVNDTFCAYKEIVSIHAPTRGATVNNTFCAYKEVVSIHAPTRGATEPIEFDFGIYYVSIHAPTRGATHPPQPS